MVYGVGSLYKILYKAFDTINRVGLLVYFIFWLITCWFVGLFIFWLICRFNYLLRIFY